MGDDMQEKSIKLQKNMHIIQLLGFIDKHGNYFISDETARNLIDLQKIEIEDEYKIDVANKYINLQSAALFDGRPLFFRVETEQNKDSQRATLFLQEEADEMGGLIAFTYLTPLAVFESTNTETFMCDLSEQFGIENGITDNETNISKLDSHIKTRNAKRRVIEAEAERLSRTAMIRINRMLSETVQKEFNEIKQTAKRFTRAGKPNYYQAQVQMVKHVTEQRGLQDSAELHPVMQVIEKLENRIDEFTQKTLADEMLTDTKPAEITHKTAKAVHSAASTRSPRRDTIINKLPAVERAAIMSSKFDFDKLLASIKGDKRQNNNPLKLSKDAPKKRERFNRVYKQKAPRVLQVIDSAEEIDDETVDAIAIGDITSETSTAREQIEQAVREGLKDHIYRREEKKATLTIAQTAQKNKEDEQNISK